VIVSKLKKAPPTFHPHEWVQLKDAFSRIESIAGLPGIALSCLNRDLRSEELGSVLVEISPDGKMTVTPLNSSDWQQRTVHATFERGGARVGYQFEVKPPFAAGLHCFVRLADLDKLYPRPATLTMPAPRQSDETQPPERRRGPVNTHDWHSIDGEIARRCIDPDTGRVQVPKKENALVAEMRTWCGERGWAAPAVSEMSEAVRRICAALRTVQK
jgi:hypothetical protein